VHTGWLALLSAASALCSVSLTDCKESLGRDASSPGTSGKALLMLYVRCVGTSSTPRAGRARRRVDVHSRPGGPKCKCTDMKIHLHAQTHSFSQITADGNPAYTTHLLPAVHGS